MTRSFVYAASCFLTRFAKAKEGAVFIFVGIGIVAAVTATMVAVEVSQYTRLKSDFRNAVDQALLAAASKNRGSGDAAQLQLTGTEYLKANLSTKTGLSDVTFEVRAQNRRWYAEGSAKVDVLMGTGSRSIKHKAEVGWDDSKKTELVAMIDMSGTMCAKFDRTPAADGTFALVPDPSCSKLIMMRDALKKIFENGVGVDPYGEPIFKVGIVPFTYKVKVPKPGSVPSFLLEAERDAFVESMENPRMGDVNYFSDVTDAENIGRGRTLALPPVVPLTPIRDEGDKAAMIASIDALVTPDPGNNEFNRRAWKRSALGAQISGMMLDPRYHAMFGGDRPVNFNTPGTEKIVIMMTDAANIGCCYTNWPEGSFRNNYIYSYNPDHQHLVGFEGQPGVCQQMKDAGIKVYTVLLDVNEKDMNNRGREIVESFEKCATDPKYAYQVPFGDKKALEAVYTSIAQSLLRLKFTY